MPCLDCVHTRSRTCSYTHSLQDVLLMCFTLCLHSGTVKQRLVGQFTTDIPGNNVTAEMMNAFRLMNIARPWNFSLQLNNFTDSTTAKVISPAASESGVFAGEPVFSKEAHG
jgi:hypothetical protein